jgi:hypothetical protein
MIYLVVAAALCMGCRQEVVGAYDDMRACRYHAADRFLAPRSPYFACVSPGSPVTLAPRWR